MRLAVPIATVALAATVLAGCGGDSGEGAGSAVPASPPPAAGSAAPAGASATVCTARVEGVSALRVSGISCAKGEGVIASWRRGEGCDRGAASRSGCDAGPYRCLSLITERGLDVSCARPGESVAFRVTR